MAHQKLISLACWGGLAGCCLSTGESNAAGSTSGPCAVPISELATVTTLAGNGQAGFFDGSGGRDGTTEFSQPNGVAVDAAGNVYVADSTNRRIRKVSPDGSTTTFAGNGYGLQDGSGGPNGTAGFAPPVSLAFDGAGNLLVVEDRANRVREVDPSGNVTTLPVIASDGTSFGYLFGIALGAAGKVWLTDGTSNYLWTFDRSANIATIVATSLLGAEGVAVDLSGNVYVGDQGGEIVTRVDAAGNVTTFAGNGQEGFVDGPATQAEFGNPTGVAVDPQGNVIVVDGYANHIRRIDAVTGNVTTIAGNGGDGEEDGTGGPEGTADFSGPSGVAVDSACNIYVADSIGNRIRKITFGTSP